MTTKVKQYKLTPKGLLTLAAINGIIKLAEETNTDVYSLKFSTDEVCAKSQPGLLWHAAEGVVATMLYGGLIKRVV